jgi:sulfhydrogenase subunit beta (sulfur reductase)
MNGILKKELFPRWLEGLSSYRIYAPARRGDQWRYEVADGSYRLDRSYTRTAESSKTIVFPQREVLLKFEAGQGGLDIGEVLPEEKPCIVLGVRPCDARALTLLDRVFQDDFEDPYYRARRSAALLVGLACSTPPSPGCFCLSVGGSPFSSEGLDVLLVDLGDRYLVESFTPGGDSLIRGLKDVFSEPTAEDRQTAERLKVESEKEIKRQVSEVGAIPAKLKDMYDSPFWEEESLRCIRCGICTYLCPTCHCFDINDETSSSVPLRGTRVRTWDTCQFPDFTMHSSGHNPRPDRASRLRQRILHKFLYFVERHNVYQCTGCGRCVTACPVGIDITEVLNKAGGYER